MAKPYVIDETQQRKTKSPPRNHPGREKLVSRVTKAINTRKDIVTKQNISRDSASSRIILKTIQQDSDKISLPESFTSDYPVMVQTSFPNPYFRSSSIQVEIGTGVKRDYKKTYALEKELSTSKSRARSSSVTSAVSSISVSSIRSVSSHTKSVYSMETKPSLYQKLVIPFSGFTEEDVRQIRGNDYIPKDLPLPSKVTPLNTSQVKRPVLKRYQSEKRKTSYERYMQENLENLTQKNNAEDSSYNTVLAVKMLVENAVEVRGEASTAFLTNDETTLITETTSKDTRPAFSDISSMHFGELMKPDETTEPTRQNWQSFTKIVQPDTARLIEQQHRAVILQEMDLRQELELVNTEYERMLIEYEEAERTYFAARLHLHKIKIRRNYLMNQLSTLEKELLLASKRRKA